MGGLGVAAKEEEELESGRDFSLSSIFCVRVRRGIIRFDIRV